MAAGDVRTEDDGRIVFELARASGSPALRKGDFVSWAGEREVALEADPVRALEEGRLAGIVVAREPLLVHPESPLKPGQQARISLSGDIERRVMVACPHCGKEIDYRSLKGQVGGKLSGRWRGHTFAGMTFSEAAEVYGVSRNTIHAWSKLPPSSAYKRMKRALARRR